MEFLIMADEMMNSSSFLDATDNDLGWGTAWPDEMSAAPGHSEMPHSAGGGGGGSSLGPRKRKVIAPLHPLPTEYKMHDGGHGGAKQAKTKCADDRDVQNNSGWQDPSIDELGGCSNLADALDGSCSLAGISVDLNQSSYNNISDALLTLPSLTVFKQELPSPGNNNQDSSVLPYNNYNGNSNGGSGGGNMSPTMLLRENNNNCSNGGGNTAANSTSSQLKSMMMYNGTDERKEKPPVPVCLVIPENTTLSSDSNTNDCKENIASQDSSLGSPPNKRNDFESNKNGNNNSNNIAVSSSCMSPTSSSEPTAEDCRFQYVLAAATSIATKVNEETQTYLNQGQSYEIKLKKLGDLSNYRGKILKSIVRLSFHERRLQYTESEQMAAWVSSHPMMRILEVDLPLSYGIVDVLQHNTMLNTIEFLWDPTKEVGVYIKVNCISTEFTPNKHGGEKGVPFRIQVETLVHGQNPTCRLHTASCQIKVFKLKGADRKHKQDREKILKRPLSEQEKYQPSYDCTVLNDMPNDSDPVFNPIAITNNQPVVATAAVQSPENKRGSVSVEQRSPLRAVVSSANAEQPTSSQACQPLHLVPANGRALAAPPTANVQQANAWLQNNRFSAFLRTFSNFSGLDLLRLSCDNLIQICGLPEGIRLFNALHRSPLAACLTLYMCLESSPEEVYEAVFLESLTSAELSRKLATLLGAQLPPSAPTPRLLLQGPAGIHVAVSDQVVTNMKDEAIYMLQVIQGQADQFCLLLKPVNRTR
ncbi:hypothetical protein LSTR_LSTR011661 [Laodelphax striatellus]|uniref:Grh/CP2 DB domain-containing protein n=1 Tax=Laodelphax striatellus TaxID=195883 RepID=A0A482WLN7_LAOST|nr:hypothetical protein LSTR_LSTR011661 [Laodelphax striatellus]